MRPAFVHIIYATTVQGFLVPTQTNFATVRQWRPCKSDCSNARSTLPVDQNLVWSRIGQSKSLNEDGPSHNVTSFEAPLAFASWLTIISAYMIQNYKVAPWPSPNVIAHVASPNLWVFVHALSNMLFGGGIILTTIMEWLVVDYQEPQVVEFWFRRVSWFQKLIVLPALTLSIVSGITQATLNYGGLVYAPIHIRAAFHILATFGLWWVGSDLTTQKAADEAIETWFESENVGEPVPQVLLLRRWINLVSCVFIALLYGFMALKPGYL